MAGTSGARRGWGCVIESTDLEGAWFNRYEALFRAYPQNGLGRFAWLIIERTISN